MAGGRTEKGKRILLLLPEAFGAAGGIQMFCRAYCMAAGRWAEENGAAVDAVVLNDGAAPDARYVNGGFSSYVGAGRSKARFIRHFIRRVLAVKYDWIVFGHVSLSPLGLLAKRLNPSAKTIVITYGIEVWRPLTKTQRKSMLQADMVLAISDFTKDELIKHNAIPAEKIRIFPCTLDPHWEAHPTDSERQHGTPVILSVTRMSKEDRYKGIDSVIKGLPAVVSEAGPVEYRVAGQGDDVPRLRALAAGLGVERYVNFMGRVPDAELREQYRQCSLFVMPSRKEGFGIVFLEAMAYGKPVVGGAHGGTPSVVKDGETGLLVDSFDVPGIAGSITTLLRDKETSERFGSAGRRRLVEEFTFDKFERNFREVIRSLARGPQAPKSSRPSSS
jgi:phosphatidylinositol alpha-1,6-mannosyltransferase